MWIGQGAADVLRAAEFWGTGIDLQEAGHFRDRQPIQIGPFTITPYLADHSAYDAYSLLVEAGGSRLFYSGDLRGHGRKHRAFERLLADPPTHVDVMLLEGTNLRADGTHDESGTPEPVASETDVENSLTATLLETKGLVVVLGSAQNIDRLVTVYRATIQANRRLAVDLYTAEVAASTGRKTIPKVNTDWSKVAAYLPLRQRVQIKESGQFHRTAAVKPHRVFDEDLAEALGSFVLFGGFQGHVPHLLKAGLLKGGAVVWSMWDGYLEQPSGQRLSTELATVGIPLIHHHTSGHASVEDLARLAKALSPVVVVPIHTEAPDRYAAALGRRVTVQPVGAWWPV